MIRMPVRVTADDIGAVASIDKAVKSLVNLGIINSLSVFVNGDTDLRWIYQYIGNVSIGLHLTFSYNRPISSITDKSLVDENGFFRFPKKPANPSNSTIHDSIEEFLAGFKTATVSALREECLAQFSEFKRIFRCDPCFISVHHDLDHSAVLRTVLRSLFPNLPSRTIKEELDNSYYYLFQFLSEHDSIDESRTAIYNLFGEAMLYKKKNRDSDVEIVFHPGYVSNDLRAFSSYCDMREREYNLLSDLNLTFLVE